MTKNTKTILLSLLACLLLITGFELGEGRIRFGSATLSDSSTAGLITTNKGFLVNGKLSTSNYADFSNGVRFGDTDIYIDDDGLDLSYVVETNGAHKFYTKSLTNLASIDSANGVTTYLPGYSNNGRGLLKTKVLQSTLGGTTPGNTMNIAHGISATSKILGFDIAIWEDSTGRWLNPGYAAATALTTGTTFQIDATNASWFIPGAAGNLKNSGDTIRWVIRYLE